MARQKVTVAEKRAVRDFLLDLANAYPGGWDELMRNSEVPRTTAQDWRYKTPRSTPSAPALLRILREAGVLKAAMGRALDEALGALDAEDSGVAPSARRTPNGRARTASK